MCAWSYTLNEYAIIGNAGKRAVKNRFEIAAELRVMARLLTIKGEKKQEKEEKEERYHRVERVYGAFTRTVRLPVAVDASKVTAICKNGLLTVTLPKTPAAKGTMIPIKGE